jgi:hypothetical protein
VGLEPPTRDEIRKAAWDRLIKTQNAHASGIEDGPTLVTEKDDIPIGQHATVPYGDDPQKRDCVELVEASMPPEHAALEQFCRSTRQALNRGLASFPDIFQEGVRLLEVDHQEIVTTFGVSKKTVKYWLAGTLMPHTALRPPIYEWLVEKARQRIKEG